MRVSQIVDAVAEWTEKEIAELEAFLHIHPNRAKAPAAVIAPAEPKPSPASTEAVVAKPEGDEIAQTAVVSTAPSPPA